MTLTELQEELSSIMDALCDPVQNTESLQREIKRAKAASTLGREMIRNVRTIADIRKTSDEDDDVRKML